MTVLTAAQKNILRRNVGDSGDTQAFSDDELQDAFDAAEESIDATTVILVEWLLANAAKFNDYTAGQTSEKKSQVFSNLERLAARYQAKVDLAARGVQIKIVGMRSVPPRERDEPYDATQNRPSFRDDANA